MHLSIKTFEVMVAVATAFALAPPAPAQALAQRPAPHLGYAYPAGGQLGTTISVSAGGQNLNGTTDAYLDGAGVQVKVIGYDRPATQKEINDLREQAQKLQEKREAAAGAATGKPVFTADDLKLITEIRQKLANGQNRQPNPAIAETVTLQVALAPDATPGQRELRLKTPNGLSNPVAFWIGQLPEFSKPVVTATSKPAPIFPQRAAPGGKSPRRSSRPASEDGPPALALAITLPAVVNGQILPGKADRFRFMARKGQRLTAAARARDLIPYLADAVPGWFQATLALYDARGRELAYADHFLFNPDPVLVCVIPADGDYTMEIKDSIYRGREDFVYRITVGELPFVTSIYPLGSSAPDTATIQLTGWNLPSNRMTVALPAQRAESLPLSPGHDGYLSNSFLFARDALPECEKTESNDRPALAQAVALPVIVNGRIGRPGDEDVFRFEGKAGDELVAEVFARRLGSPLDSLLRVTDAAGRQLALNDDFADQGAGLITHQADSRIDLKLPSDGAYYVHLTDAQHQGGAEYGYRLHLGPPSPDFELRVVPSSINVRAGASVPITVYALRRDGFAGEIVLGLKRAPPGFVLNGGRIPAHQDKIEFTLTAPPAPRDQPFELALTGRATVGGKLVERTAVPAENMMQAFFYWQLVPEHQLLVDVAGRAAAFRVLSPMPVRIPAGGTAHIRVATQATRFMSNVQFELNGAPDGITLQKPSAGDRFLDVTVSCDVVKMKAGWQGNLLLSAFGERAIPAAKGKTQRVPLGSVPAIPCEITPGSQPNSG